jgi:hypothetical protein
MASLCNKSKAIEGLGIFSLKREDFHQTFGSYYRWKVIRMGNEWMQPRLKSPKRTNVHIARQSLRLALLEQLADMMAVGTPIGRF